MDKESIDRLFNKFDNAYTLEKFEQLKKQKNLTLMNSDGYTPLMYSLRFNSNRKLNLNSEEWDYLIYNSDLTQRSSNHYIFHPFVLALTFYESQGLNLNSKQMNFLAHSLPFDKMRIFNLAEFRDNKDVNTRPDNAWGIALAYFSFIDNNTNVKFDSYIQEKMDNLTILFTDELMDLLDNKEGYEKHIKDVRNILLNKQSLEDKLNVTQLSSRFSI